MGLFKRKNAHNPFNNEAHKRTLHKNLEFTATEQYKLLRTNLDFTVPEGTKCPVIGVTSSMRGEGKSTTAINLAYVLAEKGDKVSVSILKKHIAEIARLIRASLSHFSDYDKKIPVILGGGLTNQALLLPYLLDELGDDIKSCSIQVLDVPPVNGALELAKALWRKMNNE